MCAALMHFPLMNAMYCWVVTSRKTLSEVPAIYGSLPYGILGYIMVYIYRIVTYSTLYYIIVYTMINFIESSKIILY